MSEPDEWAWLFLPLCSPLPWMTDPKADLRRCASVGIQILDADIRSFFDEISQEWLIRFLEHRIGDRRIIRLIQKWLKAGILEDGVVIGQ